MNVKIKVEVKGYQVLEKKVKIAASLERIYLTKEFVLNKLKIVLLE